MGTTLLEVANRALSRLGAVRITALTDTTAPAKAVAACFPSQPDWVLRSWLWKFAINRVALTNPETAEGTDWTWKYTLPPDCLDIVPQGTPLDDVEFVEEAGTLLCDLEAPLWLRYVRQVTDPVVHVWWVHGEPDPRPALQGVLRLAERGQRVGGEY